MIRRFLRRLAWLFWFVPGFLLWASFPPMGERMDVFFALAPVLWFARHNPAKRSARCWFVNGFVFWFNTLAWMPAIVKNGGPVFLVVLGWGALAAYCALYFGAFGYLAAKLWRWTKGRAYGWRLFALVVAEPVLWCGLELIRSRFLGGFAWNQLGVAPINAGLGSPASLGGVALVSAIVILVNGTFASIAERMLAPFEKRLSPLVAAPEPSPVPGLEPVREEGDEPVETPSVPKWARSVETLLPFLLILGFYECAKVGSGAPESTSARTLAFGLMQRNFPCVFQAQDDDPRAAYETMTTSLGYAPPDVLVLPESAFCEVGAVESVRASRFARTLMEKTGARAVIAGGSRTDAEGRQYNSVGVYEQASETVPGVAAIYDKVHLVPFGEFIPGDKLFPVLQKLAPVGSCTPGELKVLSVDVRGKPVRVGPAICFEDTDSAQMRELAKAGAEVLVFVTNDSWFSYSQETMQHAWQSVARAIETGLPVVRVGNSGVSGVIRPDGVANWLVGEDGRPLVDALGTMLAVVPLAAPMPDDRELWYPRTWYVLLGDAPLFLAFLLLILAMLLVKYSSHFKTQTRL